MADINITLLLIITQQTSNMATYEYTSHSWYSYPKVIPSNVETLSITFVGIKEVPENLKDATHIKTLILTGNSITVLENLPPNLETLICNMNKIKEIRSLPDSLTRLICNYNQLVILENLSPNLIMIDCADNKLEVIKSLPDPLIQLDCSCNNLKQLPKLPSKLHTLYTQYNYLECLPSLPESLSVLAYRNNINIIPPDYLPNNIIMLYDDKMPRNKYEFGYVERTRKSIELKRNTNRTQIFKEALIAAVWHPDRVEKLLEVGYEMD